MEPHKKPQWHRIYYLLAIFDVLVVLCGLFLNHRMTDTFENSVQENLFWKNRLDQFSELRELAQAVNIPANDIFQTRDVESESANLKAAHARFQLHWNQLHDGLEKGLSPERYHSLSLSLKLIERSMSEMVDEAEPLFSFFRDGKSELAAGRMSVMDRKFAEINGGLCAIRKTLGEVQQEKLEEQRVAALGMQKLEYLAAACVLIMILAAIAYGTKIKNRIEQAEREREDHIDELKLAEASLRHAHDELERIVKERTEELERANAVLRSQISQTAEAEKQLADYAADLEKRTREFIDFTHPSSQEFQSVESI